MKHLRNTIFFLAFVAVFCPLTASAQNSRAYIRDAITELGECRNVFSYLFWRACISHVADGGDAIEEGVRSHLGS